MIFHYCFKKFVIEIKRFISCLIFDYKKIKLIYELEVFTDFRISVWNAIWYCDRKTMCRRGRNWVKSSINYTIQSPVVYAINRFDLVASGFYPLMICWEALTCVKYPCWNKSIKFAYICVLILLISTISKVFVIFRYSNSILLLFANISPSYPSSEKTPGQFECFEWHFIIFRC